MNYQPDNLSPQQKKNAYIGISILSLFILSFFIYSFFIKKNRKELLSKQTEITQCRIIKTNTYKSITNTVEYKVSNKTYSYESLSGRVFELGEIYNLKYSILEPNISEVIYTQPIINKLEDYREDVGVIISLYSNSKVNIIKYQYSFNEIEYERDLYVKDASRFKENEKYKILVNIKNPKISYLKRIVKISN